MNNSTCVPSTPGPPDESAPLLTPGLNKDNSDRPPNVPSSVDDSGAAMNKSEVGSSVSTPGVGTPDNPLVVDQDFIPKGDERILFVDSLSSDLNCARFFEIFGKYGEVKVIKFCESHNFDYWKIWVEFVTHEDALRAFKDSTSKSLKCRLINRVPPKLDVDVVYPDKTNNEEEEERKIERSPLPARWHIVITKSDLCNIFHFKKHLMALVGPVPNKEITRFGKNSFLVHTKSHRQGHMIGKLKNTALIKEVKPHLSFSFAKGVIFNQDIYDLSEKELHEMCDERVWKFFKVPRTKMIIFTFKTDEVPEYVFIDRERFRVRAFRERPLQCFKCFGFGHSAKVCTKEQICAVCSLPKHEGECCSPVLCINCEGSHSARFKNCETFKKEMAAVEKAHAEHLSIGQAKRLLSGRPQYNNIVKGERIGKDQPKTPSSIPKPQLSPSQLEIHPASQPSSEKAPLPLHQGVSEASLGASQADLLPDLGVTPNDTLKKDTYKAQVHDEEMETQRQKRSRTPSSSPSKSSHHERPNKRGDSRSLMDLARSFSFSKARPNLSRTTNPSSGKPNKKASNK